MKKYLLALALAATLATPCFAQTTTALDPATVSAVNDMLTAMKARDVMQATMQQMQQAVPQAMLNAERQAVNSNPKLSADDKQKALDKIEKGAPKRMAEMQALLSDPSLIDAILAEMVPLYAGAYTVDEIHQLSAFYQSPIGQKMLANQPKLASQVMEISNRVMMPRIQKRIAEQAQNRTAN
jgi:hypothetical protein